MSQIKRQFNVFPLCLPSDIILDDGAKVEIIWIMNMIFKFFSFQQHESSITVKFQFAKSYFPGSLHCVRDDAKRLSV